MYFSYQIISNIVTVTRFRFISRGCTMSEFLDALRNTSRSREEIEKEKDDNDKIVIDKRTRQFVEYYYNDILQDFQVYANNGKYKVIDGMRTITVEKRFPMNLYFCRGELLRRGTRCLSVGENAHLYDNNGTLFLKNDTDCSVDCDIEVPFIKWKYMGKYGTFVKKHKGVLSKDFLGERVLNTLVQKLSTQGLTCEIYAVVDDYYNRIQKEVLYDSLPCELNQKAEYGTYEMCTLHFAIRMLIKAIY